MSRRPDRRRLWLLPWLVYVGVTVAAPAANGAARAPSFAEHAVITLGVSGAVAMLWLAAAHAGPRRAAHGSRPTCRLRRSRNTTSRQRP